MNLTLSRVEWDSGSERSSEIRDTVVLDLPYAVEQENVVVTLEPLSDRAAQLQKLVELSNREDSLDWQALAEADVIAWGADTDPE